MEGVYPGRRGTGRPMWSCSTHDTEVILGMRVYEVGRLATSLVFQVAHEDRDFSQGERYMKLNSGMMRCLQTACDPSYTRLENIVYLDKRECCGVVRILCDSSYYT